MLPTITRPQSYHRQSFDNGQQNVAMRRKSLAPSTPSGRAIPIIDIKAIHQAALIKAGINFQGSYEEFIKQGRGGLFESQQIVDYFNYVNSKVTDSLKPKFSQPSSLQSTDNNSPMKIEATTSKQQKVIIPGLPPLGDVKDQLFFMDCEATIQPNVTFELLYDHKGNYLLKFDSINMSMELDVTQSITKTFIDHIHNAHKAPYPLQRFLETHPDELISFLRGKGMDIRDAPHSKNMPKQNLSFLDALYASTRRAYTDEKRKEAEDYKKLLHSINDEYISEIIEEANKHKLVISELMKEFERP